jgi:DNA-binding response OmpR family regulator
MAYILVIDDDDQFRKFVTSMLVREGYEAEGAHDGYVGMAMCIERLPDLVVTDIVMPEKEGLGTIADLRQEFPDMKIIAVTGFANRGPDDYLTLAEKLGAQYSFSKPFERDEFLSAVEELVG